VEIHHIHPQAEGGSDDEDNGAPLCPTCHERYGGNPDWRKKLREMRDHWYSVVAVKFPTRDDITLELLNDAAISGSTARIKEELMRYVYSLIESTHGQSLPRLTDILVQGLYLERKGPISVEDLADEGPCACERQTCVESDHRVYCYFTKDQHPWVVRKRLYWKCYDEIITCPRCALRHARGHVGREDVCARPYLFQETQSDTQ